MNYCNCKTPEPEEIERGVVYCMACELEMLMSEDAPEPDFYERTQEEEDFYHNSAMQRALDV